MGEWSYLPRMDLYDGLRQWLQGGCGGSYDTNPCDAGQGSAGPGPDRGAKALMRPIEPAGGAFNG